MFIEKPLHSNFFTNFCLLGCPAAQPAGSEHNRISSCGHQRSPQELRGECFEQLSAGSYICESCVLHCVHSRCIELFSQVGYDRRVRPQYGGPPVSVGVSLYVLSVSEISEKFMDFTFDM